MRTTDLFETDNRVIKLGGFKKDADGETPARAFMTALAKKTHEHPFTRGMRYFEDGPVLVHINTSLSDAANAVELRDIQSKARGAGSRAMAALCQIADETKTTIDLFAKGYDEVPTSKLVEFYQRFGFQRANDWEIDDSPRGEGIEMVRYPNTVLREKRYPLPNGSTVDLFSNPTHRKVYSMLGPNSYVRGGITQDMRLVIWNANDASHSHVANNLGEFTHKLMFFETLEDLAAETDWGWGYVYEAAESAFYILCGPKITATNAARFPLFADARFVGRYEYGSGGAAIHPPEG